MPESTAPFGMISRTNFKIAQSGHTVVYPPTYVTTETEGNLTKSLKTIFLGEEEKQYNQIGRFFGLWATF